ncbi:hypothetical protein G210_0389 [Candida maltosa Xu316]|uniref:Uncharacterized protein n=1 Tax=Candida maltosa (strain Xu316) TaxID=1245528 RepID=M3HN93_CANMX|nr:hypothetical protein G210_0389 [Candida maltosa Xu316]
MSTPSVIVKLLFRKAMALKGQNKMDFAKKAFEDVLAVDPSNAHALSELAIFEQEGKRDSGDIKIPVEVVDELPDRFKKMLNTESQQLPKQEKKVSSGDVDKEIDELFGSKTAKVNHKEIPKVEEVKVHEKSPMHFLTALKQLPEEQKVKGYCS